MTTTQVLQIFGKSRSTLYRYIRSGIILAEKDSRGRWNILIPTVEQPAIIIVPQKKEIKSMKFLIETGNESHTTSWQKCQAKDPKSGKPLFEIAKPAILSQEWIKRDRHASVVKTVYEFPEGTDILIDYQGYEGPQKFIFRLDATKEVVEQEIGTGRLRTYTLKARGEVIRDLIAEKEQSLKASQEEGF